MLEILILIALGKRIAAKARDKGRSGTAYVLLLLGMWLGGEISGGLVVGITEALISGRDEPALGLIYLGALIGATIGAVVAFLIVGALPAVDRDDEDDDPVREE